MTGNTVQQAGEYTVDEMTILTSSGVVYDLRQMTQYIEIFEDVNRPVITGNIVIMDIDNMIENSPIIGQEFMSLKIRTPSLGEEDAIIDFSDKEYDTMKSSKYVYNCEYCNKEFSRKDNLKRHILKMHQTLEIPGTSKETRKRSENTIEETIIPTKISNMMYEEEKKTKEENSLSELPAKTFKFLPATKEGLRQRFYELYYEFTQNKKGRDELVFVLDEMLRTKLIDMEEYTKVNEILSATLDEPEEFDREGVDNRPESVKEVQRFDTAITTKFNKAYREFKEGVDNRDELMLLLDVMLRKDYIDQAKYEEAKNKIGGGIEEEEDDEDVERLLSSTLKKTLKKEEEQPIVLIYLYVRMYVYVCV